jgi:hypothetical protein
VATPDTIEDITRSLATQTEGKQPVPNDQQKTVGIDYRPAIDSAYKPADYIQQQIMEIKKQQ